MTATCPMCNSVIENDNPALKQVALVAAVENKGGWSYLASRNPGLTFSANGFTVKLEKVKDTPGYPKNGWDGAYEQGETYEAHLVFSVEGTYFKKIGTGDSYGKISWDGELKQVQAKEMIVKVFE